MKYHLEIFSHPLISQGDVCRIYPHMHRMFASLLEFDRYDLDQRRRFGHG